MRILVLAISIVLFFATGGSAQEFSGLARVHVDQSHLKDAGRHRVQLDLALSLGVPYRVFTLADPPRMVIDFNEVDWSGVKVQDLLLSDRISDLKIGTYVPGWSRLVVEMKSPMIVAETDMRVASDGSGAKLSVVLENSSATEFAARTGAPHNPRWDLPEPSLRTNETTEADNEVMIVVLDPGHGGIDPGAETDREDEKSLMLTFARELREVLVRSGNTKVFLTRNDDHFVSLEQRVAFAHQVGADVFLSLHADSLAVGKAHGATVHVLSDEASDLASATLAERHDRAELLSGVDLSTADDRVAGVLLDLARQETQPRTLALARDLVSAMAKTGAPMNRTPIRSAGFSVLKAADIPSVLIEIGFMSSARDLKNLRNPEWRKEMAAGIRNGLEQWRVNDAATRPLVRK